MIKSYAFQKDIKSPKASTRFTNKYTPFDHGKLLVSEFKTGDFISFRDALDFKVFRFDKR